jgi:hypothetical protein
MKVAAATCPYFVTTAPPFALATCKLLPMSPMATLDDSTGTIRTLRNAGLGTRSGDTRLCTEKRRRPSHRPNGSQAPTATAWTAHANNGMPQGTAAYGQRDTGAKGTNGRRLRRQAHSPGYRSGASGRDGNGGID